jgi:hypothetical protein
LYLIHPDVLDEACLQGRYVAEHFARTIIFVTAVWGVAGYLLYIEGNITQGALLMTWALVIAVVYMRYVLENMPTLPWMPDPGPGVPYEDDDLADFCEVFL